MKQVPLFSCGAMWSKNHHLGDHDFWCRLQAIAQQNYISLTILGSWYWTDWTHNHKTLKEIIESHVCCAHYPSPRIFPQKFHGKFSGKLRTQAMRSNDAWATPIPKRWSRRLWFAILMTPHRKEDFFWNTLKLTEPIEPEKWWLEVTWKHYFIFWGSTT